jgi:DtxR family Mn-dependent transcriptional regulator
MALSARIEDYMEEIFALEIEGVAPTVTELATRTGVSKPTVVAAVKRLSDDGLVVHEHYGDLSLTDAGRERALAIYRRHEHLAFLFSELFGIDRERAEAIACAMEHELDERSDERILAFAEFFFDARRNQEPWVRRMERFISNPSCLPRPLSLLKKGEGGRVVRLTCAGPIRARLLEAGLTPGTGVEMLDRSGASVRCMICGVEAELEKIHALTVWIGGDDDDVSGEKHS